MTNNFKLKAIKVFHTLIWLFFNVVIFYLLYAAIVNKIDKWIWIGYGLVVSEGLVLLLFRLYCPLTILARKYSDSLKHNFDIYLPNWLARYTKPIYTTLVLLSLLIVVFHWLKAKYG